MGRTTFSGPVTGAYTTIVIPVGGSVAATVYPGNATFLRYVTAPFACRVVEVSFMAEVIAIVGSLTWGLQNGGAAGAGTTNIVAANSAPASATVETVAAAALTNRDLAKGDILRAICIGTNAGDIITRGTITVTVRAIGHVVASSDND